MDDSHLRSRELKNRLPGMIHLELGAPGARRAAERGDVAVIIDALRASTTICAALMAGAARVHTVLTVEEALVWRGDPTCRIAGERGAVRVDGFDFGNSPTELLARQEEVRGKTVVLTTTNGTRCIHAALGASAILIGAPVNATAVARAALNLARTNGCELTLVAAGLHDQARDEDVFAQALLAHRLAALGALAPGNLPSVDEQKSLEVFLHAESGQYLCSLGYEVDVRLCAEIDRWSVVPVYHRGYFESLAELAPR